jgi:menaquinol-cytochrome c reductase iron-sulfur subunit
MPTATTHRRWFLSFLTKVVMTVLGLCLALPALGYLWAPLRRKAASGEDGGGFVDAGAITDFPPGEWRVRTVEVVREDGWETARVGRAVWVRRDGTGDEAFTVLSPLCPHLGCPINWSSAQSQFVCPCHGGTFNTNGQVIAGPPPRGMDNLNFDVRAGRLWVQWQDFKIGVRERAPVTL